MELYEYSKSLVANEKPLDPIETNKKIAEIALDMIKYKYSILFNPDLRQYVIFHNTEEACAHSYAKDLTDTLLNRGQVVLVYKENEVWEIWVRDIYDNNNYLYQLYDYTDGVIEVK